MDRVVPTVVPTELVYRDTGRASPGSMWDRRTPLVREPGSLLAPESVRKGRKGSCVSGAAVTARSSVRDAGAGGIWEGEEDGVPDSFGKRKRRDVNARKAVAREERRLARAARRKDRQAGLIAAGPPMGPAEQSEWLAPADREDDPDARDSPDVQTSDHPD